MTYVEIEHFAPDEVEGLSPQLVVRLELLRILIDRPIYVTSGHRPGDDGAHGERLAVDIADNKTGAPISSRWRHLVLSHAYDLGFRRVGDYDRHIHLDISVSLDQDVTWWGESS